MGVGKGGGVRVSQTGRESAHLSGLGIGNYLRVAFWSVACQWLAASLRLATPVGLGRV